MESAQPQAWCFTAHNQNFPSAVAVQTWKKKLKGTWSKTNCSVVKLHGLMEGSMTISTRKIALLMA